VSLIYVPKHKFGLYSSAKRCALQPLEWMLLEMNLEMRS
jgi:hypothetical protein